MDNREFLRGDTACYSPSVVRGSPNPGHFGLPARLRKTRQAAGLSRLALSLRVGCSDATVGYLEGGQRWPSLGTVARIAAALGCSAVWLAYGLGAPDETAAVDIGGLGSRLSSIRTERGLTKAALVDATGLSSAAILGIERGAEARVDTVERIAKALGVSPGWLAYGLGPMEPPARRRSARSAAASV